ncbi:hypothetical protein BpHYR1_032416 [Brachionus plicatilis]|uniref:Uncharacterized protein n=1 Tax=Brachionus plicatilis TaxID=10195 RepID=A0A3M7T2T5_BRAPC|nr:hypothetical protein BpHYR1_032416 [Brachionus plicatilis]
MKRKKRRITFKLISNHNEKGMLNFDHKLQHANEKDNFQYLHQVLKSIHFKQSFKYLDIIYNPRMSFQALSSKELVVNFPTLEISQLIRNRSQKIMN